MTTLTADEKTITSASISAERLTGRFYDRRDIRVTVTINALSDVDLTSPVSFYADIRLSDRVDVDDFIVTIYSTGPIDFRYDDDSDRILYWYDEASSVLLHERVPDEVEGMILDFLCSAVYEAERAWTSTLNKALGL